MTAAALHPIRIDVPLPAGVHLGALVRYRGRIVSEHWSTFYVAEVDDLNRLTIVDRDYPGVTTLRHVNPRHVVPTGERVDLCDACGHEAGNPGRWDTDMCEARPCQCRNHHQPRTN